MNFLLSNNVSIVHFLSKRFEIEFAPRRARFTGALALRLADGLSRYGRCDVHALEFSFEELQTTQGTRVNRRLDKFVDVPPGTCKR